MMIPQSTLTFLKKLKKNNDREWFEKHKDAFKAERDNFEKFIQGVANDIAKFDPRVKAALGDKKTIKLFRIYRDVRFSKDKSPYKTNFGGSIAPGGMDAGNPGYYVHIEPGNCFIAGGLHMPETKVLGRIRDVIAHDDKKLRTILKAAAFKKQFKSLSDYDVLKTVPRGYEQDHPAADLLRFKSYLGIRNVSDKLVTSKDFKKEVVTACRALKPLNEYLAKVTN